MSGMKICSHKRRKARKNVMTALAITAVIVCYIVGLLFTGFVVSSMSDTVSTMPTSRVVRALSWRSDVDVELLAVTDFSDSRLSDIMDRQAVANHLYTISYLAVLLFFTAYFRLTIKITRLLEIRKWPPSILALPIGGNSPPIWA